MILRFGLGLDWSRNVNRHQQKDTSAKWWASHGQRANTSQTVVLVVFPGNARPHYGIKTLICGMLFPGPILFWCLLALKIALLKKEIGHPGIYNANQCAYHWFLPFADVSLLLPRMVWNSLLFASLRLAFCCFKVAGASQWFSKNEGLEYGEFSPENSTHQEDF